MLQWLTRQVPGTRVVIENDEDYRVCLKRLEFLDQHSSTIDQPEEWNAILGAIAEWEGSHPEQFDESFRGLD